MDGSGGTLVGTEFAGYRIRRVVGVGGTSTVYAGVHPRLARTDAVKVLSPQLAGLREYRRRFHREAELASAVDHSAVVPVLDCGEIDGQPWMAMTLVDGGDVDQLIRSSPHGVVPADALPILATVAAGLDHLHYLGIVHRDVQPRNILLSDAVPRAAYLADFGVARYIDDETDRAEDYAVHGAVGYTAPERIADELHAGPNSDQYGLAVTAYRMSTGTSPFHGRSQAAVVADQLGGRIRPIDSGGASAMDRVFATALHPNPDCRFSSCIGFVEALSAVAIDRLDGCVIEPRGVVDFGSSVERHAI
ncbi:serine/threonine-protein kinase [Gordonia malaquae]|nr:serine/threonine-protein kinase [Gordonia malaquae]